MNATPLGNRVLVRRVEEETLTRGGLYIPNTAREKPEIGVVIAVGRGTNRNGVIVPLEVKPGDRILFGKYAGMDTEVEGEELLILLEEEILCILAPQPAAKLKRGSAKKKELATR